MLFFIFTVLLTLAGFVRAVEFISPPPSSGVKSFGANPVYTIGSAIQVAWTGTGDTGIPFSVVVYQVDYSDGITIPADQAFEYVVHNAVNLTSTNWVVGTAKNLTFSHVFAQNCQGRLLLTKSHLESLMANALDMSSLEIMYISSSDHWNAG
ncbi:hypothetical protein VTH06DRAFT_67 [Thermothelomyces fergusii]